MRPITHNIMAPTHMAIKISYKTILLNNHSLQRQFKFLIPQQYIT